MEPAEDTRLAKNDVYVSAQRPATSDSASGDTRPDISVIIPTHNRLWALPQAIASCRKSRCRTEIIVVDDGSTDGTWAWLQSQEDVVSVRTEHWGKCWAANTGLAAATGEYVRYLDSDDWLLDGANDRQLDLAYSTGADVIVAGYEWHDEVAGRVTEITVPKISDFFVGQIHSDCFYSAYLMRRAFVAEIPHREEFPHQDSLFALELAIRSPVVATAAFCAVAYRSHVRGHLSDLRGIDAALAAWRCIAMYERMLATLDDGDGRTRSRAHALRLALFEEARNLSRWDMAEANEVVARIRERDARFTPPVPGVAGHLYRTAGFPFTERLRHVLGSIRRVLGRK